MYHAANISETITDELMQRLYGPETVLAEVKFNNGQESTKMKLSDVIVAEKLEKFIEDVKCESDRLATVHKF